MSRPLRVTYAGALYHLCSRGVGRRAVFEEDADCQAFVDLLASSVARFDVALHAWVLMGNHFHLLATTRRANRPRWIRPPRRQPRAIPPPPLAYIARHPESRRRTVEY